MVDEEALFSATELIANAKYAIALTGAGISAESGIPTFRGKDGLWNKYRPEELATPEAFTRNPKLVWDWYSWRIGLILRANPNPAHYALTHLEKLGMLKVVITQNVDDLHERAGTKNIIKLHGNILIARCQYCGNRIRLTEPPEDIPHCPKCGEIMRPDVVWFGEPLPSRAINRALEEAKKADLILVIGTSGVVYPAGLIPHIVKEYGGKVIEINLEQSNITPIVDIFLRGKAGIILPKIIALIERESNS